MGARGWLLFGLAMCSASAALAQTPATHAGAVEAHCRRDCNDRDEPRVSFGGVHAAYLTGFRDAPMLESSLSAVELGASARIEVGSWLASGLLVGVSGLRGIDDSMTVAALEVGVGDRAFRGVVMIGPALQVLPDVRGGVAIRAAYGTFVQLGVRVVATERTGGQDTSAFVTLGLGLH